MKRLLISAVSALIFVAGCSTEEQPAVAPAATATAVVVAPEPPPPPPEPEAKVMTLVNAYDKAKIQHIAFKQVALDELTGQVAVSDVRRSKTNDGYDRVQVFLKNFADERMKIRYRFNWTDSDGVEVRDPDHDAWERLAIDPGDDATLTSIAPTKNCYDFKLRLRRIKEKGNE